MTHLKLALVGSASLALVLVLAARIDVSVDMGTSVRADQGPVFDDAWKDIAGPIMLKSALTKPLEPKIVTTQAVTEIVLPEIIAKPEELTPKLKKKLIVYRPAKKRDVCARHGMRKVPIRHGRSWRCRK